MKRTAINRRSKKRDAEERVYLQMAKEFRERNPVCWVKGPNCTGRTTDCHHRVSRARWRAGYLEESNFVAACFRCHGHIHVNPVWATSEGWMASGPRVGGAL